MRAQQEYSSFELSMIGKGNDLLLNNIGESPILELGVGLGSTTKLLCQKGYDVVVVDSDKESLEKVAEMARGAHCADWVGFESDEEFSDIVCFRGLDCVDDLDGVMTNLRRLSNQKTIIHIIITNSHSFHRRLAERLEINNVNEITQLGRQVGRRSVLNDAVMMDLFHQYGLQVLKKIGIGFKMYPNAEMDKLDNKLKNAFIDVAEDIPASMCVEIYYKLSW